MHIALLAADLIVASEEVEGPVAPWIMGLIGFLILMGLLVGVMAFGGGREHS